MIKNMLFKQYMILSLLGCIIVINTLHILNKLYKEKLNMTFFFMPIIAFHTIAFIVSFLHWTFDTWTVKNDDLRTRTFNQAKTHHYHSTLVVKKKLFDRNDDSIYGALFFGLIYIISNPYCSINYNILIYSLMISSLVSLEIHRYAHMNPKKVPYFIRLLQKSEIILSKESHFNHHNGEFRQSYDLMSGIMNIIVNWIGIYPALEKVVTKITGAQPRTYLINSEERQELHDYYKSHKL